MTELEDKAIIEEIVARRGRGFVDAALEDAKSELTLTIVSNSGLHPIPEDFVFGELYVASVGSFDFGSIESVNNQYDDVIRKLHVKLVEKPWTQIYLIPFGHSTLCMNIKMAVYRTLRIETKDVFYFGDGKYGVLERDTRSVLAQG